MVKGWIKVTDWVIQLQEVEETKDLYQLKKEGMNCFVDHPKEKKQVYCI